METFSFNPALNNAAKRKWLLTVTSFEATNSIFDKTNENNSFLISKPGHWNSEDGEEFINKLKKFLELRSENDIEPHKKQVEKRSTRKEMENSGCILAGFDHINSDMPAELQRAKYKDLENFVFRMKITYDENVDILDVKFFAGSDIGYALSPRKFEISHFNLTKKSFFSNEAKVKININDFRQRSNLSTNKKKLLKNLSFLQY